MDTEDGGQKWRDKITPDLDKAEIYIQDPCKTEPLATGMDVMTAQQKFNGWIQSGNYDIFSKKFKVIVDKDLRMVKRSDFLTVQLFPDIPTTGTIHEMAEAWRLKKPIYIIWYGAKSKLSKWAIYLATSSGGRVFDNFSQYTEFINVKYQISNQSLRVQVVQFIKSVFRILDEKIYITKLNAIRKTENNIKKLEKKEEKEEEKKQ